LEFNSLTSAAIVCVALALLVLERTSSWRRAATPTSIRYRWATNLGLMLLGSITVAAVFPASVQAIAADLHGGWIQRWQLPPTAEVLLVFLLLDAWRYWEHRILHEVRLL